MQQISRDNHYIPQMYLKNWATDKKVWAYNLLVSDENVPLWSRKSVNNTAFYTNLYTRIEKGNEIDELEHDFCNRFESPAKVPFDKIINNQKLTAAEWKCVSRYIAAQYIRTPAFFQYLHNILPEMVQEVLEKTSETISKSKDFSMQHKDAAQDASLIPIDVEFIDENPDEKNITVKIKTEVGKSYWFWAIKHFLEPDSVVLQSFCNMKWSIIVCPEGCSFPTTDNPVTIFYELKNGDYAITNGLAAGNNMIVFPVAPQVALIGKYKNRLDYKINAKTEMFDKLKKVIISNASRFIYSDHEDLDIPLMRSRTADRTLYMETDSDYNNWYNSYIEQEVPIIRKWEDRL